MRLCRMTTCPPEADDYGTTNGRGKGIIMKKSGVVFAIAICLVLGCSRPKPNHIQIDVANDGSFAIDGVPCKMGEMMAKLTVMRQRAMADCSVRIVCASNLTSSAYFQVSDQAAMSGIWSIGLELEGDPTVIDCSRVAPDEIEGPADLVTIRVSGEQIGVNGSKCALSDLSSRLEGKTGNVIVIASGEAPLADTFAVLRTCESLSLKPLLFSGE
jgi:hypothetical protein